MSFRLVLPYFLLPTLFRFFLSSSFILTLKLTSAEEGKYPVCTRKCGLQIPATMAASQKRKAAPASTSKVTTSAMVNW